MKDYQPDPKRYDGRMPYRKCGVGIRLPALTLDVGIILEEIRRKSTE